MKRLLLASHGVGALPELVGGDTRGLRFAFVPTAAGTEAETKEWVQADRRQLASLGCEVSTLDLAGVEAGEVEEVLRGVDGVFLTGGNSFLLLWHAVRSSSLRHRRGTSRCRVRPLDRRTGCARLRRRRGGRRLPVAGVSRRTRHTLTACKPRPSPRVPERSTTPSVSRWR